MINVTCVLSRQPCLISFLLPCSTSVYIIISLLLLQLPTGALHVFFSTRQTVSKRTFDIHAYGRYENGLIFSSSKVARILINYAILSFPFLNGWYLWIILFKKIGRVRQLRIHSSSSFKLFEAKYLKHQVR